MSFHSGALSGGNRGSEIAADTAQRSTTSMSGNSGSGYPMHPRKCPRIRNVTNAPARRSSGISGIGDWGLGIRHTVVRRSRGRSQRARDAAGPSRIRIKQRHSFALARTFRTPPQDNRRPRPCRLTRRPNRRTSARAHPQRPALSRRASPTPSGLRRMRARDRSRAATSGHRGRTVRRAG